MRKVSGINLSTCSYRDFRPDMGLPVATSIGQPKWFQPAVQLDTLKPFGVFRKLDHLPLEDRIIAYHERLDRHESRLRAEMTDLMNMYPDTRFVLLCWCHLSAPDTGPMGCHRRWAAAWFADRHDKDVPELGPQQARRPDPPPRLF